MPCLNKTEILLMDNFNFRPEARFMLKLGQDISAFPSICLLNSDMSYAQISFQKSGLKPSLCGFNLHPSYYVCVLELLSYQVEWNFRHD